MALTRGCPGADVTYSNISRLELVNWLRNKTVARAPCRVSPSSLRENKAKEDCITFRKCKLFLCFST